MVFLRVLKSLKRKEKEIRVLLLGLDNAGKTTAVKCLIGEPTDQIAPTLGFSIKTIEFKGCRVNIWDIGGQKVIRGFWRNYFEETDGLIWVVDSAEKFRLEDCRRELHSVLKEERLIGASLLILFNKCDLKRAVPVDALKQVLGLKELATTHRLKVQRCSALTGEGLLEGFDWLISEIMERRDYKQISGDSAASSIPFFHGGGVEDAAAAAAAAAAAL